MPFAIPALEGYFGGKGGSGVYQQIINIIPPHDTLVVPFLGHCGITRNIKPCSNWYLNDIDRDVVDEWINHYEEFWEDNYAPNTTFLKNDFRAVLKINMDRKGVVHYLDSPYRHDDRKSRHRYNYEMTDKDHIEMLELAKGFYHSNIIISTYDNKLYRDHLKGWNTIKFKANTRRGMAIETAFFNYEPPIELHDYSYFGKDYRDREQKKRKRKS